MGKRPDGAPKISTPGVNSGELHFALRPTPGPSRFRSAIWLRSLLQGLLSAQPQQGTRVRHVFFVPSVWVLEFNNRYAYPFASAVEARWPSSRLLWIAIDLG